MTSKQTEQYARHLETVPTLIPTRQGRTRTVAGLLS